jgi:hypothetical protein
MNGPTIRTAPDAIAASHCLLSKMATNPETADHRECNYCGWSAAELTEALEGFWTWEGSAHAVEVFERANPLLRLRRIDEAAGYRAVYAIGPVEA